MGFPYAEDICAKVTSVVLANDIRYRVRDFFKTRKGDASGGRAAGAYESPPQPGWSLIHSFTQSANLRWMPTLHSRHHTRFWERGNKTHVKKFKSCLFEGHLCSTHREREGSRGQNK